MRTPISQTPLTDPPSATRRGLGERRLPWLKLVGLAIGAFFAFTVATTGHPRLPGTLAKIVSERAQAMIPDIFVYSFLLFGFLSLVGTASRAGSVDSCGR
jgi:hypothetical protein